MNAARIDEQPKTWFRSDRVFLINSQWFFPTREGGDVGPYDSQFEAEIEYQPESYRSAWRALVSVMGDSSEHTGQINYLRGLMTGSGWR